MSSFLSIRLAFLVACAVGLFASASLALASTGAPSIALTITDQSGNTGGSVQIVAGEEITLDWFGEHVTNCQITPGPITALDENPAPDIYDGSYTLTPDTDTSSYDISCDVAGAGGDGGETNDSATATLSPTLTMDVNHGTIEQLANGSFVPNSPVISWTAERVTSCDQHVLRKTPNSSNFSAWRWVGEDNFADNRDDDGVFQTGVYRYQRTCTGLDGSTISAGTQFELTRADGTPSLTLTATPGVVMGNETGRGSVDVSWTADFVTECHYYLYHTSPVSNDRDSIWTSRSKSGSIQIELFEPGLHQFSYRCTRMDNGNDITANVTAELSFEGIVFTEQPELTLDADPSSITLAPGGGIASTNLTWVATNVNRCDSYIQRMAPNQTTFEDYLRIGSSLAEDRPDDTIAIPGTYSYRLTCHRDADGASVTDTAEVVVDGDAVVPEMNLSASPATTTVDSATGIASSSITWSYNNVNGCDRLALRYPGYTGFSNVYIYPDPRYQSAGSYILNSSQIGTHQVRLECEDLITNSSIFETVDINVLANDALGTPNMTLNAELIDDDVTLTYQSENFTYCDNLQKRAPDESTYSMFGSDIDRNTSGTITDSNLMDAGIHNYRLVCGRLIDDVLESVEVQVTYRPAVIPDTTGSVSGSAALSFGECRDASGTIMDVPEGYEVNAAGNCVPLELSEGEIVVSLDATLVRSGSPAGITWEYDGDLAFDECLLQGPGLIENASTGASTSSLAVKVEKGVTGTAQTDPRYATSLYHITCTNDIISTPVVSTPARLEVVPTFQEV